MNLFKATLKHLPNVDVCNECGVVFKLRPEDEGKNWHHLCNPHAVEPRETFRRFQQYLDRCARYRDKLEPLLKEMEDADAVKLQGDMHAAWAHNNAQAQATCGTVMGQAQGFVPDNQIQAPHGNNLWPGIF